MIGWTLLALVLLGWKIGDRSFEDWDEAGYAQVARQMVRTGNWLAPLEEELDANGDWYPHTLEYQIYFQKPPLFLWSTAAFYSLLGESEASARATAALFGALLVGAVFLLARSTYDAATGSLAASILLTSYLYTSLGRSATTATMLVFFIFAGLYGFHRARGDRREWWLLVWVAFGLAFLTKSAAALLLPAIVSIELVLARSGTDALRSRYFWWGLAIAAVVILPWHAYMFWEHGRTFVDQYVVRTLLLRATTALEENVGGRTFYAAVLSWGFYPWVYLAPFALARGIRKSWDLRSRSRLLLVAFVVPFTLFTAARTKIYWYILPALPAAAILIAALAREALRAPRSFGFGGLALGASMAALTAPKELVLAFLAPGGLVLSWMWWTRRIASLPLAVVLFAFLLLAGAQRVAELYQSEESPSVELARIAGSDTSRRGLLIVGSGLHEPAIRYYSERSVVAAGSLADVVELSRTLGAEHVILSGEDLARLGDTHEVEVLARAAPYAYAAILPDGAAGGDAR